MTLTLYCSNIDWIHASSRGRYSQEEEKELYFYYVKATKMDKLSSVKKKLYNLGQTIQSEQVIYKNPLCTEKLKAVQAPLLLGACKCDVCLK